MTTSEKLTFTGAHDRELAGRLELPDGQVRAVALFAHCFTCSKDTVAASRISRRLAGHGVAVLRFDFTGLGGSEGEFANTNFTSNVDDLVLAADHLRNTYGAPTVLIGHSLGGAAVLAAAHRVPEAQAVVTIAAPADPEHVTKVFGGALAEIEAEGEAKVTLAGREFQVQQQFLEDISGQPQRERIAGLGKALLVMHAPLDNEVGVDNARLIFDQARHSKSFVSLDGADHLLTRREDARYVADVLDAWVDRYLPSFGEDDGSEPDDSGVDADTPAATTPERGLVRVEQVPGTRLTQRVQAGPHSFLMDEPTDMGGDDTGPDPYAMLLAALGACTSMTLRMYAERRELPLEHVAITLEHSRIHAKDCDRCETETGRVDHIRRVIELTGDLDDTQRARLTEIADRCPVHRTLQSQTVIDSTLADDDEPVGSH